jgi:hypothetical protein
MDGLEIRISREKSQHQPSEVSSGGCPDSKFSLATNDAGDIKGVREREYLSRSHYATCLDYIDVEKIGGLGASDLVGVAQSLYTLISHNRSFGSPTQLTRALK